MGSNKPSSKNANSKQRRNSNGRVKKSPQYKGGKKSSAKIRAKQKKQLQEEADKLTSGELEKKNSFQTLNTNDDAQIDSGDEIIEVSESDEDGDIENNKDEDISDDDNDSGDEIVLIDSDDDSEEAESEVKNQGDVEKEGDEDKDNNDLTKNADFIAFDFSEPEEDNKNKFEYDNYDEDSQNEYLSNDDGAYHTKSAQHKIGEVNHLYPWIRNSDHSKQIEISDWLTMEIKDFVNYVSPSIDEIKKRNETVQKIRNAVTSLWPDAELHCFGSFATDLYLPGSDIDMVIVSKNGKYDNKSSLYQLSSYLRTRKLGINIEPIAKAKVPIIKFVEPESKIHIDISFEKRNGIRTAETIIEWIKSTPGLRELVLIIKQFLAVRKLNNVHVGGLGGFSIICLVYSFLRLHPRIVTKSIDPMENLGVLLIEFFELYGYNFAYDLVGIGFEDSLPVYVKKGQHYCLQAKNTFTIGIIDPHDSSNNISRGTFNLRDIKRSFGGAFELLTNQCYFLNSATYKERLGQSILGGIIKFKGKERDFDDARGKVTNEAYAIASGSVSRSNSGLPPLPSEKTGLNPKDYEFYTDSETSDDDGYDLDAVFQKSQESNKKKNKTKNSIESLMGVTESDNNTDAVSTKGDEEDKNSDNNENDSKPVNKSFANKSSKREYWLQKSGNTF
ncbi:hypothetical protein B5S29_g2107 [[Candida] boidinii]|nr:hypothetical protein B5S29_g2107 [[Candida] boidinii]